jgi:hypothetical protein
MLVNFLMEVLNACYSAGAEVVATVCDMGANSVKALKQLGVSEDAPFFRFQTQEIAALILLISSNVLASFSKVRCRECGM